MKPVMVEAINILQMPAAMAKPSKVLIDPQGGPTTSSMKKRKWFKSRIPKLSFSLPRFSGVCLRSWNFYEKFGLARPISFPWIYW